MKGFKLNLGFPLGVVATLSLSHLKKTNQQLADDDRIYNLERINHLTTQ